MRYFRVDYFVSTPDGRRFSCCYVLERDLNRARLLASDMCRVSGVDFVLVG